MRTTTGRLGSADVHGGHGTEFGRHLKVTDEMALP